MMEAACTSETSVDNYFTRQYIPEDNPEQLFNTFGSSLLVWKGLLVQPVPSQSDSVGVCGVMTLSAKWGLPDRSWARWRCPNVCQSKCPEIRFTKQEKLFLCRVVIAVSTCDLFYPIVCVCVCVCWRVAQERINQVPPNFPWNYV
jgi:hypothetical protein